jgi:membrane-bound lytic murein transglycosylase D
MASRGFLRAATAALAFVLVCAGDCVSALAGSDVGGPWVAENPVVLGPATSETTAIDALQRSPFVFSLPRRVPPFPIVLNQSVQRYVREFLNHPAGLQLCFQRSNPYFSEMVRILRSHSLPDNIIYLAFAESAFSSEGRGPWQFSAPTARRYGLRIDSWVDERRDPILSTKAAAQHLAELHDAAGNDWWITLAGWNIGETAIDRYKSLSGREYTKFASHLPLRTRKLMNRFMAVAFIANNAPAYGIGPVKNVEPPIFHTITVNGGAKLATVAKNHGTTLARLKQLNPALLRDSIPARVESYEIRLPLLESASTTF